MNSKFVIYLENEIKIIESNVKAQQEKKKKSSQIPRNRRKLKISRSGFDEPANYYYQGYDNPL
jgi:hypothetical protein